jgi:hypothetical protein
MAIHDKRPDKEQFCDNCGESLGVCPREARDFLVCSARVCLRAEREHHRAIADGAAEFESEHRFDRYGGSL